MEVCGYPHSFMVVVTSLPTDTAPMELMSTFLGPGYVADLRVAVHRHTLLPAGFAFVEYISRNAASLAVQTLDGFLLRGTAIRVSMFRPPEHGVGQVAEVAPSLVFFAHFRPVLRLPLPGFFRHDHRHSFPEPQEEEPVHTFQVRQIGQPVSRTLHDIGADLSRPKLRNIRIRGFPLALVYPAVRYTWLYYQFRQA